MIQLNFRYPFDKNRNITTISKDGIEIVSYKYDGANELTRENNAQSNETIVYAYDNGGNITSISKYEYTTDTEITSKPLSTKTYSYEDSEWRIGNECKCINPCG